MEAYTSLAKIYDDFMDNVPYDEWGNFIHKVMKEHNIDEGLVLDLACGTGIMTEILASFGYEMIGVDNSPEMLEVAKYKKESSSYDILYLLQDMKEFELYGTVKAIISVCDSINYVLEPSQLKKVFSLVDNYLDPGGLFIFDFNTDYKYKEVIGNQTIAESRDDKSFIWENYYYEEERINQIELNLFIKENILNVHNNNKDEIYRRYTEKHYQRAYSLIEIQELLEGVGLEIVDRYDDYTYNRANNKSERILVIAKECKKYKEIQENINRV